jgi:hypothetical protein
MKQTPIDHLSIEQAHRAYWPHLPAPMPGIVYQWLPIQPIDIILAALEFAHTSTQHFPE